MLASLGALSLLAGSQALATTSSVCHAPFIRSAHARAAAPRLCAVDRKGLYNKIEVALKRAKRDDAPAISMRTARALSQRWLEISPADLVEATFVSGALILDGFDEGLAILLEAEDTAGVDVSSKAYFALCRMAVAEERGLDVLALLARARSRDVPRTDGLLLAGMQAASELEDWGAVARLHAELSTGPEAAAELAAELEASANPAVLEDLQRARGTTVPPPRSPENEIAQALCLALRAHVERGDVDAVRKVLGRMRSRAVPLSSLEYQLLGRLATNMARLDPLLALRPVDAWRSLEGAFEPRLFAVSNKAGELAVALGTAERTLVAAFLAALVVVGTSALLGSTLFPHVDPTADLLGL